MNIQEVIQALVAELGERGIVLEPEFLELYEHYLQMEAGKEDEQREG